MRRVTKSTREGCLKYNKIKLFRREVELCKSLCALHTQFPSPKARQTCAVWAEAPRALAPVGAAGNKKHPRGVRFFFDGKSNYANRFALCIRSFPRRKRGKRAPCGLKPHALSHLSVPRITKSTREGCFLLLVEPTGIEPVSKNLLIQLSSRTVCLLSFPIGSADKQARLQSSPFLLDRFKGETPMQVHY